jgi:phage-related protein
MKERSMLFVTFYKSAVGNDPVVEWFRNLDKADGKRVGLDLLRVQENWPIGMPLCKPLGKGLWEVRSALSSNRISRVIFFMQSSEICVVHGFIKKTQATPQLDLELARKRMKEMQS